MKVTVSYLATLLWCGSALAGPVSEPYASEKNMVAEPVGPCYLPGFEFGLFGSGIWGPDSLGNEYHPPVKGDDALGAGVSLAYFFTARIGLEYSYAWHATESDRHLHTLDLRYRMPLGDSCLAPYLIGGGGVNTDGGVFGVYRAGAGLEYRPEAWAGVGIFADYTHNWIAGGSEGWGNSFNQGRVGIRFQF
jgi:hypothetical protein